MRVKVPASACWKNTGPRVTSSHGASLVRCLSIYGVFIYKLLGEEKRFVTHEQDVQSILQCHEASCNWTAPMHIQFPTSLGCFLLQRSNCSTLHMAYKSLNICYLSFTGNLPTSAPEQWQQAWRNREWEGESLRQDQHSVGEGQGTERGCQ